MHGAIESELRPGGMLIDDSGGLKVDPGEIAHAWLRDASAIGMTVWLEPEAALAGQVD